MQALRLCFQTKRAPSCFSICYIPAALNRLSTAGLRSLHVHGSSESRRVRCILEHRKIELKPFAQLFREKHALGVKHIFAAAPNLCVAHVLSQCIHDLMDQIIQACINVVRLGLSSACTIVATALLLLSTALVLLFGSLLALWPAAACVVAAGTLLRKLLWQGGKVGQVRGDAGADHRRGFYVNKAILHSSGLQERLQVTSAHGYSRVVGVGVEETQTSLELLVQ
mmetsp:Transcript_10571/g.38850  ORF Transcript_10571/g.38850 Transcript_10571/m.38850 type:complete len:225 (-) Transcript_10571:465-1139(-)